MPRPAEMSDEAETQSEAMRWTGALVAKVDKRLREAVSADELKKLTIDNGMPEFKKVL